MKVYFIYNGKDTAGGQIRDVPGSEYKLKMDIPASWMESPCERLLLFFIKTFNGKNPDAPLNAEDAEMKIGGVLLKTRDTVSSCVREYNDIIVLHRKAAEPMDLHEGEELCTNFGCGKYFKEEENADGSCNCHTKPPVFHDLEKFWGCCPDMKAVEFDAFQAIPSCHVGRHSTANKPFAMPKGEISNVPLTSEQAAVQAQSTAPVYEDRQTRGPREFEHAAAGPQEVVDGKAKCRNFGCAKVFDVAENSDTACSYHSGGPIFHEGRKWWSCCPEKKFDDFDGFTALPGCATGSHKL